MRLAFDHAVGMDIDEVVIQEVAKGRGVTRYLGPKPIPFRPGDRRHCRAAVLDRRLNAKVPVTDPRVVALQHQRAGGTLIAVDRPAGDARNFHLIDDRDAVQVHRKNPPNQGDIERLPLAGRLGRQRCRGNLTVNAAHQAGMRALPKIVLDLNLMAPAKVDPAIPLWR